MKGMTILFLLVLLNSVAQAQTDKDKDPAKQTDAAQQAIRRLDYMKKSVHDYEFLLAPEFQAKLTVEEEPLLRFTNPVSGLQDGGFFVWKDDSGRPMVGAQVFLTAENLWIHEFQSLSPGKFRGARDRTIRRSHSLFWSTAESPP